MTRTKQIEQAKLRQAEIISIMDRIQDREARLKVREEAHEARRKASRINTHFTVGVTEGYHSPGDWGIAALKDGGYAIVRIEGESGDVGRIDIEGREHKVDNLRSVIGAIAVIS